ncbi:MAG: Imm26 family immunity protein [Vicinamibacteria bacterium]
MAKFKAGDLFSFPLPADEFMCGRVQLDVKNQCVKPRLLPAGSMLSFFDGAILVEVYRDTSKAPFAARSELLLPGIFIDGKPLASGAWRVMGYEAVDPAKVEFPEGLKLLGPHAHLVRGEVYLPLKMSGEEMMELDIYPTITGSGLLGDICLNCLGRAKESPNYESLTESERSLAHSDLRFSEHRERIYQLAGADPREPYFEFALRRGFDIRRFYS